MGLVLGLWGRSKSSFLWSSTLWGPLGPTRGLPVPLYGLLGHWGPIVVAAGCDFCCMVFWCIWVPFWWPRGVIFVDFLVPFWYFKVWNFPLISMLRSLVHPCIRTHKPRPWTQGTNRQSLLSMFVSLLVYRSLARWRGLRAAHLDKIWGVRVRSPGYPRKTRVDLTTRRNCKC